VAPPFGKTEKSGSTSGCAHQAHFQRNFLFYANFTLSSGICLSRDPKLILPLGPSAPGTQGREADHSPPPTGEVNNAWNYISTPPIHHHIHTKFVTSVSKHQIGMRNLVILRCITSSRRSQNAIFYKLTLKLQILGTYEIWRACNTTSRHRA
jgi:hypothetical protein